MFHVFGLNPETHISHMSVDSFCHQFCNPNFVAVRCFTGADRNDNNLFTQYLN